MLRQHSPVQPLNSISLGLVCVGLIVLGPTPLQGHPLQETQADLGLEEDSLATARGAEPEIQPPYWEGPLFNDAFLPLDTAAQTDFETAESAWEAWRGATQPGERQRALDSVFDAWAKVSGRLALGLPGNDAAGVAAGRTASGAIRLTEGVRSAITRRVAALEGGERQRWRELFEGVAEAGVASRQTFGPNSGARDQALLAWPGTMAAARAAIRLLDSALESGYTQRAQARLREARSLVALLDQHPDRSRLDAALSVRAQQLRSWSAASSAPQPRWKSAESVTLQGSIRLFDRELPLIPSQIAPGRGTRPGLAAIDAGSLLVQTSTSLWRIELNKDGRPLRADAAPLDRLLGVAFGSIARPRVGREVPGWQLAPRIYDGSLFLVHGAREGRREGVPNVICKLPLPTLISGDLGGDLGGGLLVERRPDLEPDWALSGDFLWHPSQDPQGTVERIAALAPLAQAEWQPGFAIVDNVLVVQARVVADRIEAWLVGLDPGTGKPLWTTLLGGGAGQAKGQGRFSAAAIPHGSAPALLPQDGLVLACTKLGFQALVDPQRGEVLWTLATRRKEDKGAGWALTGPFLANDQALFAPPDSDRIYRLRMAPLRTVGDRALDLLGAGPILAQDNAEALLGPSGDGAVVIRRDGRERTVSLLQEPGQLPLDAFHLVPQETFRGRALTSKKHVLVATDRALYLLDRRDDLSLVDVAALDQRGKLPGGDVIAADPWVIVLGFDALWVFSSKP